MKVLMVHLSDIHVKSEEDYILGRASNIAEAVRNLDHDLAACFVVVSGDSTFSGTEEQYYAVMGLLQELKDTLTVYLRNNVEVQLIVVPGNHDCDMTAVPENFRETLIEKIDKESTEVPEDNSVEACTIVQNSFFEYMQQFDEGDLDLQSRLYYEYHFKVGEYGVLFRCYNTAWLSQRAERQGQLQYPVDIIGDRATGFALNVAVFHHPYNWLHHENARVFKKHVERVSDVILTGHEHDQTRESRMGAEGERNLYIEGGVLQETGDNAVSTFNALVFDISGKTSKQKFFHFSWDGELYVPVVGSSETWEELQVNKLIARRDFEISETFEKYLEDPGVQLTHPSKDNLTLTDIFVPPDLRELTHEDQDDVPQLIKGTEILDRVLEHGRLTVLGTDKSGKTSLAKWLFSELRTRGRVPVLINGSDFKVRNDRLNEDLVTLFEKQYSPKLAEKFKQLHRSEKTIIIDDFDRLNLRNPAVEEKFLRTLADIADGLVLLSNDQAQHIRELMGSESEVSFLAQFPPLEIQELGHVLREDLIGQWYSLNDDHTLGATELARKLNEAHSLLDTLIGKNFVPSYPVFVLSVLQALEVGTQVDPNASTYGYFYELFIKTSLAEKSDYMEYDVKIAYLSFLAYRLFTEGLGEPTLDDLKIIHREYEKAYALSLPFEALLEDLKESKILESLSGAYRFKYKYIYYYFVANYVKDNVSEGEVRALVSEMSERIYVAENANILLFLSYLVKDKFAIEQMLAKARKVFEGYAPAKLEEDAKIFDTGGAIGKVSYKDSSVTSSRRTALERMDAIEEANRSSVDAVELVAEVQDEAFEYDVAMKTIQILGQMLKNFPGSLQGDRKAALTRECHQLGMRTLAAAIEQVMNDRDKLVSIIAERLKSDHPESVPPRELEELARRNILNLTQAFSFGIVKHVSNSIGSPKLTETYKAVLEQEDGSAAARLIHHAVKLDHEAEFPQVDTVRLGAYLKKNRFAMSLLRYLVVKHFYMFHEKRPTRQSVCDHLGISYEKAARIPKQELRKLEGGT